MKRATATTMTTAIAATTRRVRDMNSLVPASYRRTPRLLVWTVDRGLDKRRAPTPALPPGYREREKRESATKRSHAIPPGRWNYFRFLPPGWPPTRTGPGWAT